MVTRALLPAAALLVLLAGCGGGGDDDVEAKQAALAPEGAEAVDEPAPTATPPAAGAAAAADPLAPPVAGAAEPGAEPAESTTLTRESFSYTGGSRDPFLSLLSTSRVGPELADLDLVAIYYQTRSPASSVVVMRDKVSGKRYSLRPGDRLGRSRLSSIRPKDVTFTIDDFGTERQVTLSLRKREDTP